MKMSLFERELNIEYINKFIRQKGLATHMDGDKVLSFKLYDLNWRLTFEQERLHINVIFELGDDINIPCLMQAMNKLNEERYIVKTFVLEYTEEDNEGKSIPNAPIQRSIVFSFESLCFTESAFEKLYEFCVYALTDAMDYHRKLYAQYLEANKLRAKEGRIGFTQENVGNEASDATVTKNNHRKIGFV